jgi:hypothetical protein
VARGPPRSGHRWRIEATPDDYEAAYNVFTKVCKRTVINLSDTHRKILGALYDLNQQFPNREGFTQREVAKEAKVSLSTVSDNKTFLATSAKLIKETQQGLTLVEGAEPSWWTTGDLMAGLPTPENVRSWWENRSDPPPEGGEHTEQPEHVAERDHNPRTFEGNGVRHPAEQEPNTFGRPQENGEQAEGGAEHGRQMFGSEPNTENGIGKPKTSNEGETFGVFEGSSGSPPPLTADEVQQIRQLIREGMEPKLARKEVLAKRKDAS